MIFLENVARGCMPLLYFLSDLRNFFFDFFFTTITHLGEETLFLLVAIVIFWCVNKRFGYYVLITGLVGTVLNQFLKIFFRIPRPWVLDTEFNPIEDAVPEATGYSFPSGHTQNVAGTYGTIAAFKPGKKRTVVCVIIILLVAFSRMYLGVHTPLDVGVSLLIALVLILVLRPVFATDESFDRLMPIVVGCSVLISLGFMGYVLLIKGGASLDSENYHSALKNACTLLGCTAGLVPVYFIDRKFVRFNTSARWYSQFLKLLIGLAGVLVIKSGLATPLTLLFGSEMIGRAVRYFLIVIFAGIVWPLTFKFFADLRIEKLDSLGSTVSDKTKILFRKNTNK